MENLEKHIEKINESAITALARSYNILDYSHTLRTILTSLLPNNNFNNFAKFDLHKAINYILTNRYKGESGLKAKLVEMFIEKDVTAAFEIRVNNSRVDFLTINGDTKSYEIKSGIDNLKKLAKQVSDYEKVFEYNYIVIDEKHLPGAINLIPAHYGIYVMVKEKLVRKKIATKNCCLEAEIQLRLFTKKELGQHFIEVNPIISEIAKQFSETEINERFKIMLKKRYAKKWTFLKENLEEILPIDYQYFFHHNIQPQVIYGA